MKLRTPVFFVSLMLAFTAGAFSAEPLHWSFAPVRKPAVPAVKNAAWIKDGVDVFILSKLEAEGIAPNPDADRATLLRRATFDLTGLPPTPDEVSAFLRDPASDDAAFAKVVDRLLASPRFGERWARHWLDVVRRDGHARSARDDPPPPRPRSRSAHLQLRRPRFPADECVWKSGAENSRVGSTSPREQRAVLTLTIRPRSIPTDETPPGN